MFAGHYAPALLLRARSPVPLWKLFVAVQAVDLLFFALVPLGIEQLSIDPTQDGNLALVLSYMPWSHSLVAGVVWAAVAGVLTRSPAIAAGVASHWLLDLPMHNPDLPLAAGQGLRVGLGLWNHPVAACVFEGAVLWLGFAAWYALRGGEDRARAGRILGLVTVLTAVLVLQTFVVPLPTSIFAVSAMSQASYAAFAAMAWWAERARVPAR